MKLALVCPANILYLPYVTSYIDIINDSSDDNSIDYRILTWNRLHIDENIKGYTFNDKKIQHKRNYWDYLKYKGFLLRHLKKEKYDKIIVFTLPLGYFLKNYLIKNYAGNYIFDIRDYHKIFKYVKFDKLINHSSFTAISSPAFKRWLPETDKHEKYGKRGKYIVNHNTGINSVENLPAVNTDIKNKKYVISTIGIIRHWDITEHFVNTLGNSPVFDLHFYGDGDMVENLKNHVKKKNFSNIKFYGRYNKEEEKTFYENADMINVLNYDNNINLKTNLVNRLYNAAIYGKPLLALKGPYFSEQVAKFNLGLVVDSLNQIESEAVKYFNEFDIKMYEKNRVDFLTDVIEENELFKNSLLEFIKE